jgi:hypothetical protein
VTVFKGNIMIGNTTYYFVDLFLPSQACDTEYALITGQSDIGYKRYLPTATLGNQTTIGLSEKQVSSEVWDKSEDGDTVAVTFPEGIFGYTFLATPTYGGLCARNNDLKAL